jgi:hypothetical protein
MSLFDEFLSSNGNALVKQLARNFNLDEGTTQAAIGQMLPAITRGVQRNSASSEGMDELVKALDSGRHRHYADDPASLTNADSIEDGNRILGHVLKSKDVSRNVAGQAAAATGLDSGILKQMLPMIAAAAMGMMSKQSAGAANSGSTINSMLVSMLDTDGDGSVTDDLLDMAKKFF